MKLTKQKTHPEGCANFRLIYLSDYDKKNAFNIERFLSARLKLRPDEQFAAYSIDLSGDEAAEETGG